ncbi:LLM class flavin-dependent oxidoreductase [Allostreptomyces psammosilenae]|uniref:Alkanesulfonate monooxygenase SsuD/methylene tetrahydromethanopterin reductase-like flavin-dependent oxidoreductase (Luciferase family) n=1 Tax=Allostreptomyces psammosilenae TaxID=1892865 RepID=A0A853A1L0_9ACTN|nr:LLM class flavin-dependent oxidoreductase [Allostreptomyces psammosilenae]NYI04681.1 alkanesulfonate monooxygenase SsuD/methylene tetrahydromethanopterin reductase-like flavin-dependent oxidoreductase (luciferase family) [Allostreptomyces psammosilenae]
MSAPPRPADRPRTATAPAAGRLRHGVVLLPEHPWSRAAALWAHAERLGFDHAWTYDHLRWRFLHAQDWYGAVPTLAAAATVTSRIRLGTLVASPAYRHPVTLAKELATLDDISGGRLICGLGAGGGGYDEEMLGGPPLTPAQRAERFEEFVTLTKALLRGDGHEARGRWFATHRARLRPTGAQRPRIPLAVAATGPRGMRLAARHAETWVTAGAPGWGEPRRFDAALPLLRRQTEELARACADTSRDPASLRRMLVTGAMVTGVTDSVAAYQDACAMVAELGFTDLVVHWPRDTFPYRGRLDVLEDIAAEVLASRTAPAPPAAPDPGPLP